MNTNNQILKQYTSTLFEATQTSSVESLIQFIERKKDIIEDGSDSIIRDTASQNLSFDEAFVLLDGSKSLVTKNIIYRRTINKLGAHLKDFIPPIITPELLASYLNARPNDVAIMSFHVISGNRVGVFVVRKAKYAIGWPGIGDTVYNFTYLDGLKPEFLEKVKQYAQSISNVGSGVR